MYVGTFIISAVQHQEHCSFLGKTFCNLRLVLKIIDVKDSLSLSLSQNLDSPRLLFFRIFFLASGVQKSIGANKIGGYRPSSLATATIILMASLLSTFLSLIVVCTSISMLIINSSSHWS